MSHYFEIVCSEMILSNYSSWAIFSSRLIDSPVYKIFFSFFFCRFRSFKYETDFKYLKLLSHKVIRFPLMARLGENFKADCSQLLLFFNQYYLKWERGGPWSIVLCFVWYVKSQWELQCKRHAFSFAFDAFSKRP